MMPFRLVRWVIEEQPVKLYGDGSQRRDFTYVDDIAAGTLAALRPYGYEVINLGSDTPVTVRDAIHLVEELVGKPAKLDYEPKHPADMDATWADIGKARSLLGWQPRVRLREGLAQLVAWYQQNREWVREVRT